MTDKGVYEVIVRRNVMIRMRDGISLAADIYLPAKEGRYAEGKFPSILVRTSYDKDHVHRNIDPEFFTSMGYVFVAQDVRGRYKSEGSFYHGVTEAEDSYDTIEWIAQQPWSAGKVGMTGSSYLAAIQSAAAIMNPPHLKSLFHIEAPVNYYSKWGREGGALMTYVIPTTFMFAVTSKEAMSDPKVETALLNARLEDWIANQPYKKGTSPLSLVPASEKWLIDIMNHESYDDYWKGVILWTVDENWDRYPDIAGYHVGGWYDTYDEADFYEPLAKKKGKAPIKLLMGPWTHGGWESYSGDVDFGEDGALSYEKRQELQLRWFDQTLKGLKSGILDEPPVKILVMGGGDGRKNKNGKMNHGGGWRFENEWPLARAVHTKYYFRQGGLLDANLPPPQEEPSTYFFDPENPVPTIGGTSNFGEPILIKLPGLSRAPLRPGYRPILETGAFDQKEKKGLFGCKTELPLSSRRDVLAFSTPPLSKDLEVTGHGVVKIWASSSSPDTDFTAKLIDHHPPNEDYPEGYAMNLVDSIIRAKFRKSLEKPELMKPGEIYEFAIRLPAMSNLFKVGHRLRVDISSSNFPTFDVNPNTGEPPSTAIRKVVAENSVYHDPAHPSHIILPIIPSRS